MRSHGFGRESQGVLLVICLMVLGLNTVRLDAQELQQTRKPVQRLEQGKPMSARLAGQSTDGYELRLSSNQFARSFRRATSD